MLTLAARIASGDAMKHVSPVTDCLRLVPLLMNVSGNQTRRAVAIFPHREFEMVEGRSRKPNDGGRRRSGRLNDWRPAGSAQLFPPDPENR